MFARKVMPFISSRTLSSFREGFIAVGHVFGYARPKVFDAQKFLLIRGISCNCALQMPRSTHFQYIGDETKTPRELSVLAKKAKKSKRLKSSRQNLKEDLEETLKEERLKEDIEDVIEMVRKRLNLKEKEIVKLKLNIDYLLSQQIPFPVVSKICKAVPKALALELAVLKKRISAFKVNSIFEESIIKILKKNPKILSRDVENMLTIKVETLRRLPFGFSVDEVVSILERCPSIIEYTDASNIPVKVKFLEENIGFNKKQVRRILLKYPAILTMKMNSVKEKVDFCCNNFNTTLENVSKYPRILQSQLDRLKERSDYLEHVGVLQKDVKIKGWAFKGIAANSDVYFAEKIAHKPLKKLRDYQTSRKQLIESSLEKSSSS